MSPPEISAFRQAALRAARAMANSLIGLDYDPAAKFMQVGDVLDDTRRMVFYAPFLIDPQQGLLSWGFAQQPSYECGSLQDDGTGLVYVPHQAPAWPNDQPRRMVMCAVILKRRLADGSLGLVPRPDRLQLPRYPQVPT